MCFSLYSLTITLWLCVALNMLTVQKVRVQKNKEKKVKYPTNFLDNKQHVTPLMFSIYGIIVGESSVA